MKRLAIALTLVSGVGAAFAGTAGASGPDTNVGVQVATITQTSLAIAPAVQFGGGFGSVNLNSAKATSANFASIGQWQLQLND